MFLWSKKAYFRDLRESDKNTILAQSLNAEPDLIKRLRFNCIISLMILISLAAELAIWLHDFVLNKIGKYNS